MGLGVKLTRVYYWNKTLPLHSSKRWQLGVPCIYTRWNMIHYKEMVLEKPCYNVNKHDIPFCTDRSMHGIGLPITQIYICMYNFINRLFLLQMSTPSTMIYHFAIFFISHVGSVIHVQHRNSIYSLYVILMIMKMHFQTDLTLFKGYHYICIFDEMYYPKRLINLNIYHKIIS